MVNIHLTIGTSKVRKELIDQIIRDVNQMSQDVADSVDATARADGEIDGTPAVQHILPNRKLGYVDKEKETQEEITVDTTITNAEKFEDAGEEQQLDENGNLTTTIKSLYNILLAVAIAVAVIVGTYLAVKLITSSVEGQAKIKEMFIPYIVGCIVAFGAFGIWGLVMNILNSL